MEGVGGDGRLFLFERPSPEAVQNKILMLYLDAEQKRDELKDQLKYKVDQLTRKEEGLVIRSSLFTMWVPCLRRPQSQSLSVRICLRSL